MNIDSNFCQVLGAQNLCQDLRNIVKQRIGAVYLQNM